MDGFYDICHVVPQDSHANTTDHGPRSGPGADQLGEAAKTASDDKPTADAPKKATVPDFVGMGLQSAQDKAQGAGLHGLTSHDALGRERMQAFDRNWKVRSQTMEAGAFKPTDTDLDVEDQGGLPGEEREAADR